MLGVTMRTKGAIAEHRQVELTEKAQSVRVGLILYRVFLLFLVSCFAASLTLLLWWDDSYYSTPLSERIHHPQHQVLKPSGTLGHPLGVIGTLMMLSIFIYSLYKRSKRLQRIGTQAQWLQLHIFLGVAGPILVTFHTSGKLGGIVAVAFYSMWAMVLSGVVGRYLYAKIPRTLRGNMMTSKEIESQLAETIETLDLDQQRQEVLGGIETFLARTRRVKGGLPGAVVRLLLDDIRLPVNFLRVWCIVGADRGAAPKKRLRLSRLVLRQQRLLNQLAVLDASQRLFSYWHVFHKPFTVLTFAIVFVHISVAGYLGYGFQW